MTNVSSFGVGRMAGLVAAALVLAAGCGSDDGGGAPFASGSPWPKFRGDAAQTGRGSAHARRDDAAVPWVFHTGKGIFSSPVIGADETVYIGSADRNFYAIDRDGHERFHVETGEIIDSSGLLDDRGAVYFGSGDGHLYAVDARTGAQRWRFAADDPKVTGGLINWYEGNVALGPDGSLYAPNDNRRVYAVDRETGTERWSVQLFDQTWSLPAVDERSGRLFIGNNNLLPVLGDNTYAIDADGHFAWSTASLGSVAASPMLLREQGLMVVGGFDGYLRAYRVDDGSPAWSFAARYYLYASPAQGVDGLVIQAAADGTVYALQPDTGALVWQFDTRDPIRSSPAVDADGNVYFGGGDGRLYVLDKAGALRFRIRLSDGERNDLNSSPALGRRGVYLGGESGDVYFVPYDYCLGAIGQADPRCDGPAVGEDLPADGTFLFYTNQLGDPLTTPPTSIDANQALTFSLYVRQGGDTRLALLDEKALSVAVTPPVATSVVVSPDRRFVTVIPEEPFAADAAGKVQVQLRGPYLVDPHRTGLRMEGGSHGGDFDQLHSFALTPAGAGAGYAVPTAIGQPASAFELYRLAAPLPTILPSYNQIGFDSMSFVGAFVEGDAERAIAWVVGGRPRGSATEVDPASRAMFPVVVTRRGGLVTMENRGGFSLEALNLRVTFDRFLLSTRLDGQGAAMVTPTVHVSTPCEGIQLYGEFMRQLGFCNATTDAMTVSAAALYRPWGDGGRVAPAFVDAKVTFARVAGGVTATLGAVKVPRAGHAIGLLLVDASTGAPVLAGYGVDTEVTADGAGDITAVKLTVAGALPAQLRAYLLIDLSAMASAAL